MCFYITKYTTTLFYSQLQQILDDTSTPSDGEEKLAALTAGERTVWAQAREEFFAKGLNKASLDIIEKAAFVVALDDIPYEYTPVCCLLTKIKSFFEQNTSIYYIKLCR